MHHNTLFQDKNLKNFLGRGTAHPLGASIVAPSALHTSRFRRSVLCVPYFQCRLLATLSSGQPCVSSQQSLTSCSHSSHFWFPLSLFFWFPHFLFTAENTEKSQHTSFKGDATNEGASVACSNIRGVVVNFDLGERFPRPRSQQRGSLHPRVRCVFAGGGHPPAPGNFF